MNGPYCRLKSLFLELGRDAKSEEKALKKIEKSIETRVWREEEKLLRDAKRFFAFCVSMIAVVLLYYSKTGDEFFPLALLTATAIVFWAHADRTGRIHMVAAASIGYAHEVVGGMEGWFVYTSGAFFQTPLWLIPGYAAIYWAAYNLWVQGRRKYKVKERNVVILIASALAAMIIIDAVWLGFRPTYWAFDFAIFGIMILLFSRPADRLLAIPAGALMMLEEFMGYSVGAWQHYSFPNQVSTLAGHVDITAPAVTGFSFVGLIPPYILFLWGSMRFVEYVNEKKLPMKREFALMGLALGAKTYTWLSSSAVLAALLGGFK